jgi:ribosomal protein S18 acetylase RimI-like enzyme
LDPVDVVSLICTARTFLPVKHEEARWLDDGTDLPLFQRFASATVGVPPSPAEWEEWRQQGYRYCALMLGGEIVAKAAIWTYSDAAWELAAVATLPGHRRQGYGKKICSFATAAILAAGRDATCHVMSGNEPMLRLAERIGYRRVPG